MFKTSDHRSRTRWSDLGVLFAVLAVLPLSGCLADIVDRFLNPVDKPKDWPRVEESDRNLHEQLFIIDLHADTMLWDRDLLSKAGYGHVDLPRLIKGNVALQVFAMVTKTPSKANAPPDAVLIPKLPKTVKRSCVPPKGLNTVALLQVVQGRPSELWFDLEKRAMAQAERLKKFIKESQQRYKSSRKGPYLLLIESVGDLEKLIRRRQKGEAVVGALLALEGAHWLGEVELDVEAGVDRLFEAGFRMLAPTHRFNNALGASSEGCYQTEGLEPEGKRFLLRAQDKRKGQDQVDKSMILDLAHSSDQAIHDGIRIAQGPVVISHTGVRKHCEVKENKVPRCDIDRATGDEEIRAVARTGGIVGIGYWPQAVGYDMANVVSAFVSAHRALSKPEFVREMRSRRPDYDPMDHIALGSDYDGAVEVPFDTSNLVAVIAELRDSDIFDNRAIAKIAGRNACRVFATRLPGGSPERARTICSTLGPK